MAIDTREGVRGRDLRAPRATAGCTRRRSDVGYDRERALFPEDVFGWLEDTQPDELAKVVKPGDARVEQAKAREQLLDRLVKVLDPRWTRAAAR